MGALQLEQVTSSTVLPDMVNRGDDDQQQHHNDELFYVDSPLTSVFALADPTSDSVHQTGTSYSSNNAGDGPEKTRDRKSWFPRFKSNWLGTFRSKQMFQCCECAVVPPANGSSLSSQAGRYKGAEGKHCRCGKDQWHLAKSVEETEYNRRMEISKALGGMRYDEAVLRLRSMGQSELDFKPSEHMVNAGSPTQSRNTRSFSPSTTSSFSVSGSHPPKRARSVSSGPLPTPTSRTYAAPQLMKPELSTLSTMPSQVYGYDNPAKQYGTHIPVYVNSVIEYAQTSQPQHSAEYEQLTPAPFGDEEGFGELLQGILEDDPRVGAHANMGLSPNQAYGARYGYYAGTSASNGSVAPLKRTMSMPSYAMAPSMIASPPREGVEQEYYDPNRRSSLNLGASQTPTYVNYQQPAPQQPMLQQQFPYQQHQPQQQQQVYSRPLSMTPTTATSTSFSA